MKKKKDYLFSSFHRNGVGCLWIQKGTCLRILSITETICGLHEKRLLDHLLMRYNYLERPVINESEALLLTFGITLQQIIDVVSTWMVDLQLILLFSFSIHVSNGRQSTTKIGPFIFRFRFHFDC